jgi:hypothetical protein
MDQAAVPGINNTDSVEQVYLASPTAAGAYTCKITYSGTLTNNQQRYSLLRGTKVEIPVAADVKEAYEQVQKPKTRAERRAIDEPLVAETETEELPVKKKERRSDYLIQRHDERRNATRRFKMLTQVLSEDEEEDLPW